MARLRAAWALADTALAQPTGDAARAARPAGSAWRQKAREILAYADYRAVDIKAAQAEYRRAGERPERAGRLRAPRQGDGAFLEDGGAVNFGTVPADAVPPRRCRRTPRRNRRQRRAAPTK